jgi:hypothetical protein
MRIGWPDESGWLPAAAVPEQLDELLARACVFYATDDWALAGTFVLNGYARTAVGAALVSLVTERRVPDVAPENTAMRFGPDGIAREIALAAPRFAVLPGDPDAGHPNATVVADVTALRQWLRERFVDGHIAPLIEPLRVRTRRGLHALWATASDMCAGVLAILAESVGSGAVMDAEARAFLATGPPLIEAPSLTTGWHRLTCCLAYRLPDHGLCASCPCRRMEE